MIARTWRGWAPARTADEYERHYRSEVAEHLRAATGFPGARLLRLREGDEEMFTSITLFTDLDAVRAFAGDEPGRAVVEEGGRRALCRWDEWASHHEVAVDRQP